MTNEILMLYGSNGCGRSVAPIVRKKLEDKLNDTALVFVDDNAAGAIKNNIRVLSYLDFIGLQIPKKMFNITIADCGIRETLARRCLEDGILPFPIISDNVVIMDDVKIGQGPILSPFVTLTSNIVIGDFFHANLYSYVEHDCVIGNYVTFAPGVKCNGNVHIQDNVYVGSGAIIKQGTSDNPIIIGEKSIIGMGAVVTKSVPAGSVVIGNPAYKYIGAKC